MKDILIHIGYHKTGTSWLQNEIFTSDSDFFIPLSNNKKGHSTIARDFIYNSEGYLLNSFDDNVQVIKQNLNDLLGTSNLIDRVPVISHERLSGNPHSSGFDASIISRRIKNIFPQAKILIIIREQCSWILSNYFQYLSIGGTHGIKKYLNTTYDGKRPNFSPDHVKYHHLIEVYHEKFGKKNVLVFPYELLNSDKVTFLKQLGSLVKKQINLMDETVFDKRYNVKKNHHTNYQFRFLNTLIYSSSVNNYSWLYSKYNRALAISTKKFISLFSSNERNESTKIKLYAYIKNWAGNRFDESNQITHELTKLDLHKLNYSLPTK